MDRCFNLEDVPGKAGYESAHLIIFFLNRYRDTLSKMGNEVDNDYRYIQLSQYVKAIFGVGLESL